MATEYIQYGNSAVTRIPYPDSDLSISGFKDHAKITHSVDDALIPVYLYEAVLLLESRLGFAITQSTYAMPIEQPKVNTWYDWFRKPIIDDTVYSFFFVDGVGTQWTDFDVTNVAFKFNSLPDFDDIPEPCQVLFGAGQTEAELTSRLLNMVYKVALWLYFDRSGSKNLPIGLENQILSMAPKRSFV